MPTAILPELGAEIRTFVALCAFANESGEARVSLPTLTDVTGISRPTVRDHLKALEKAEHVDVVPQYDRNGKRLRTLYRLPAVAEMHRRDEEAGGKFSSTPSDEVGGKVSAPPTRASAHAHGLKHPLEAGVSGTACGGKSRSDSTTGEARSHQPTSTPADAESRTDARGWPLEPTSAPFPLPTFWTPNRTHRAEIRKARTRGAAIDHRAVALAFEHAADGRTSSNWGAELTWLIRAIADDLLGEHSDLASNWETSELDYVEDIHGAVAHYHHVAGEGAA
ncbi:hypothetical protein [Gordonia iterans]